MGGWFDLATLPWDRLALTGHKYAQTTARMSPEWSRNAAVGAYVFEAAVSATSEGPHESESPIPLPEFDEREAGA